MKENIFKRFYVWLYIIKKLAAKEIKTGKDIPLAKKIFCWSKGFFSSSYILYDFKQNNFKEYLSDYAENVKAIKLNDESYEILDDKIKFSRMISQYLPTSPDLAVISKGSVFSLYYEPIEMDTFLKIIEKEKLILKPIHSAAGEGVLKVAKINGSILLNDEQITEKDFINKLSSLDSYLVSIYIKQAQYSSNIFPGSVNTIRILTMIDPDNNEPFIAAAAHRFGTSKSAPVDNCNAGGITSNIDIPSGTLGSGIFTYFGGNNLPVYNSHPDTNSQIKGVIIPGWDTIKEKVLYTAGQLSNFKYIGWDIVVREGDFIVLEGNNGPDIKLHQVHTPLLRDSRVKAFYKFYGVI